MTLSEARINLDNIKYDDTAWQELKFYINIYIGHHYASFLNVILETGNPMVSAFCQSIDLNERISLRQIADTETEFELAKGKTIIFYDDIIEYLRATNLQEIDMVDLLMKGL